MKGIQRYYDKGHWFRVPNAVIDHYGRILGPSGIAVYCVLAKYANNLTRKAFPSHSLIASKLGISRRTVIRKLKKLKQLGLVLDKRRKGKNSLYIVK
ncbi:MAG TPA: helix-turn-helix domain-containing protein [Candidatus Brocadiia bacterium]